MRVCLNFLAVSELLVRSAAVLATAVTLRGTSLQIMDVTLCEEQRVHNYIGGVLDYCI